MHTKEKKRWLSPLPSLFVRVLVSETDEYTPRPIYVRKRSEINVSNMWPTCGVGAGLWGWFLGDRRLDIVYSLVAVMRWSREVLQKNQSHIVYINFKKYLLQIEIIFTFFKQCFILPDNFITHTLTNNFANTSTQIYTRAQFFFISVHGIKIQGRRYSRYFIQNNAIFLCFKSIHKIMPANWLDTPTLGSLRYWAFSIR